MGCSRTAFRTLLERLGARRVRADAGVKVVRTGGGVKAGQGEGLLVATGRRVWVNLHGQTSPGEFATANTNVLTGTEVDDIQNSSDRRNGYAAKTAALCHPGWR
jgi:hypothetical protein